MTKTTFTTAAIRRAGLLAGSAMALAFTGASAAAQVEPSENSGIQDIVVTAQKREQSLQDVPIAVTALTADAIRTNRITSVLDLGAQAPNLNVRSTAGGIDAPTYTLRGSVTYGTVSGQDKTVSVYLDGVYMASAYGSAFDLPDLERIEVLRGPQGTLFGRNSTAGAISITTLEPSGEFSLRQQFTYGNYNQLRSSTRVELPQVGPFSASISYTHSERDGEVKNIGRRVAYDFSKAAARSWIHKLKTVTAKRLGDRNNESVFAALKFEPSDDFKMVYKFDWAESHFTPEANQLVAILPGALGAFGSVIQQLIVEDPLVPAGQNGVNVAKNPFTSRSYYRNSGHNLTATYTISDNVSVKNVFGYRKSGFVNTADFGGWGTTISQNVATNFFGAPALAGSPISLYAGFNESHLKQWSDEIQVNYDSDLLTLTTGAIYFDVKAENGTPDGLRGGLFLVPLFGGVIDGGQKNYSSFSGTSLAGYAQAEVHVTPQLDVIGGYRLTRDKKNGVSYTWKAATSQQLTYSSKYRDSRSSIMLGVNYKPSSDLLLYAKYSTGFVSGGEISGYEFEPETVKSWEAGVKSELLDRRLRANLAVFSSKFKDLQAVSGGRFLPIPDPDVGTLILREGDLDTKGFELELTALPVSGFTLNGALGYTDVKLKNVNTLLKPVGSFATVRPKWTANVSAQYDTQPLFGDAFLTFRLDGTWRSRSRQLPNASYPAQWNPVIFSDPMWLVNGRVALREIDINGSEAEIAVWGRNLTDSRNVGQSVDLGVAVVSSYTPARTYGIDLTFDF